jgi:hypothetical protein
MVLDLQLPIIEHAVMLYGFSFNTNIMMQHARREQMDTYQGAPEFTTACITQFYQSSNKQTFLLLCFNTIFWSNGQYWIGIVEEKGATEPANVHATILEKHSNSEPHSTRTCKSTCHNT